MIRAPLARLPLPEFIALMGMTFATVALSIDAMLPALGEIAAELSPDSPNRAQLIVTSFVFGMGAGTLVTGPMSDAWGRRTVIFGSAAIYIAGCLLAWMSSSLEMALAARVLQGLGAAGPRIAALAIVRDLYQGREMARVMSFCMMVFTVVPAIAPLIGAGIVWLAGWRAIFAAFVLFSLTCTFWLALRQPETLMPEHRRPFRPATLAAGIREVLGNRQATLTIATLALIFGILFATLSVSQPVFDKSFDRAANFPYWFSFAAITSGLAGLLNARIVMRFGMRRVVSAALTAQVLCSGLVSAASWSGILPPGPYFALYVAWMVTIFFMAVMTIGNLNALGMEPLGHLAGLGASIIGSFATIGAVLIAVPIGLAFDGTPLPRQSESWEPASPHWRSCARLDPVKARMPRRHPPDFASLFGPGEFRQILRNGKGALQTVRCPPPIAAHDNLVVPNLGQPVLRLNELDQSRRRCEFIVVKSNRRALRPSVEPGNAGASAHFLDAHDQHQHADLFRQLAKRSINSAAKPSNSTFECKVESRRYRPSRTSRSGTYFSGISTGTPKLICGAH